MTYIFLEAVPFDFYKIFQELHWLHCKSTTAYDFTDKFSGSIGQVRVRVLQLLSALFTGCPCSEGVKQWNTDMMDGPVHQIDNIFNTSSKATHSKSHQWTTQAYYYHRLNWIDYV